MAAKDATINLDETIEINDPIEIRPVLAIVVLVKTNISQAIDRVSLPEQGLFPVAIAIGAQAETTGTVAAMTTGAEIAVANPLDAMEIATEAEAIRNPAINHNLADQPASIHPSR